MMHKQEGYTLIELLVVAMVIGLLLAIAVPNLMRARISSNEANARKGLQTIRDAEALYFNQDLDDDGVTNYTAEIGDLVTSGTLRCPKAPCNSLDSLIDDTFQDAVASGNQANCINPKTGYCYKFSDEIALSDSGILEADFGWESSMKLVNKTGRKDFIVFSDGTIRCTLSLGATSTFGTYSASRSSSACDD